MQKKNAVFRFYEELNDFLPIEKRKKSFTYSFTGKPTVKDAIEATGIPHPEIDLIIVNGTSVGFDYHLSKGDYVSVYPVLESIDITPIIKLRHSPLRNTTFILDVNLGKLARWLRLLGFDSDYYNTYSDEEIVKLSIKENRIILTRDQGLLKIGEVTHGYWVRSTDPQKQVEEIINRFDLHSQFNPLNRCMVCNEQLQKIEKEKILDKLQPKTAKYFNEFYKCVSCEKVYWKGSHYKKMVAFIENFKG